MHKHPVAAWSLITMAGALVACSDTTTTTAPLAPVRAASVERENFKEATCVMSLPEVAPYPEAEGKGTWELSVTLTRDLDVEVEGLPRGLRVIFIAGNRQLGGARTVDNLGAAGIETETARGQFVPEDVIGQNCEVREATGRRLIASGVFVETPAS